MDAKQFKEEVVNKTLRHMGLYSKSAAQLITGVVWQESGQGEWLKQLGNGPAVSFIQMEPNTHDDIWENFLKYREELGKTVESLSIKLDGDQKGHPHPISLMYSLPYQVAMCRCHFLRVKEGLPKEGDVEGMAKYWKKYYNTEEGKGTVDEFIKNFPDEIL